MITAKLYRIGGWDSVEDKRILIPADKGKVFRNRQQLNAENKQIKAPLDRNHLLWVAEKDLGNFTIR